MVVRNKQTPNDMRPRLPQSRNTRTALYVGGAVVIAAAALIGVHFATSSSGGTVAVAPPPGTYDAGPPKAGGEHAGSLQLNVSGQQLASWNATSSFCPGNDWQVPDGKVAADSGGFVTMSTTGKPGSCVALISPDKFSSGVIEAEIDFPALPGKPGTIANWTSVWLTNQATWPKDGEIDAVEAEPVTGKNAVAYHWGTEDSPQSVSTDGFAPDGDLPAQGPNLTPGWHVVDIVSAKGFFARADIRDARGGMQAIREGIVTVPSQSTREFVVTPRARGPFDLTSSVALDVASGMQGQILVY